MSSSYVGGRTGFCANGEDMSNHGCYAAGWYYDKQGLLVHRME